MDGFIWPTKLEQLSLQIAWSHKQAIMQLKSNYGSLKVWTLKVIEKRGLYCHLIKAIKIGPNSMVCRRLFAYWISIFLLELPVTEKICLLFFSWELLIETQNESLYNSWCFKICYNTAKLKVRVQVLQFQTIDQ